MPSTQPGTSVKVWDPLVRSGHWALVVAFVIAWLSAEEEARDPDLLHVWTGYAVGVIVAGRVLWGLIGTRHARFSDFAYGPVSASRYLISLLRSHPRRYLGHSPAAAVMIFALLFCLASTVGTGLVVYGDNGKGPLAATGGLVATPAYAEKSEKHSKPGPGQRGKESESVIGELHGALANITLGLVILHVLGVGLSSLVHRENLVGAMFSGRKRPADDN